MRDLLADLDAIKAFTDDRLIYEITKKWLKRAITAEQQLAEAQADNAAMTEAITKILNKNLCNAKSDKPFIGNTNTVPLMEAYMLISGPHPGATLLAEVEQLRKVRDELLNYRKYASVWCDLNENHAWQRVEQALAQAKAGEPE